MAVVLGVRCCSEAFAYVVLAGTQTAPKLLAKNYIPLPVGEGRGGKLASFRSDIYDLLSAHGITDVYFRRMEGNAKTRDAGRAEVEGVLQEVCYSHDPRVHIEGRLKAGLKKALNFAGRQADVFQLFNRPIFAGLPKTKYEEAAVVALSGL